MVKILWYILPDWICTFIYSQFGYVLMRTIVDDDVNRPYFNLVHKRDFYIYGIKVNEIEANNGNK